jgi:hypothetical protein
VQDWRPDPDRHLSLLFDVFALGQRTRTLLATAMRGCGIRPDEYAAYSVVFEAESMGARQALASKVLMWARQALARRSP